MLAHIPCGGKVVFGSNGTARCLECGKIIRIRISSK